MYTGLLIILLLVRLFYAMQLFIVSIDGYSDAKTVLCMS